MAEKHDFASLMAGAGAASRDLRRLRRGESVEGVVVQIGADSIFIDVGLTADARMDRAQLEAPDGSLSIAVGDKIRASVASAGGAGVVLVSAFGKGTVDMSSLQSALDAGVPVTGTVARVVNGGVEVQIGGARGFCPASHMALNYVADLEQFVGQELRFRVIEIRPEGKGVVLSRKAQLEAERAERAGALKDQLQIGTDHDGVVTSVQKYGAFVDLGGVEGLVHVSEVSQARIDRVEDVLNVGDAVRVRVLGVEPQEGGGLKIRLSMKALAAPVVQNAPAPREVLDATVSKLMDGGVLVDTAKGSGFVPKRELVMNHSADMRRAFPVGSQLRVVLLNRDDRTGRIAFSARGVAEVEERENFTTFARPEQSAGMGSLGQLLAKKFGLAAPPAEAPAAPNKGTSSSGGAQTGSTATTPAQPSAPVASGSRPSVTGAPAAWGGHTRGGDQSRKEPPIGVVRRKKD